MTVEKKLVFDFSDIQGVAVECKECGGRLVIPFRPNLRAHVFDNCPFCGTEWLEYDQRAETVKRATQALVNLRSILGQENGLSIAIKLEFTDPRESEVALGAAP